MRGSPPDQEFGDLQLRFALGRKLHAMPYGISLHIEGCQVRSAWPPTGEHAPSTDLNIFRALALAHGGNRPETSYTTDERIENDLDGSFKWHRNDIEDYFVFHRLASHCPQCAGSKQRRKLERVAFSVSLMDEVSECAPIRTEPCDCRPAPTQRKGD